MRVRLITAIPVAIAAVLGLTSTAQAASVSADPNCTTFTIDLAGLQPGDSVMVGEGSQPPYGFIMGGPAYFQFAVNESAGTAHAALPIDTYEATHGYEAVIYINDARMFDAVVTCAGSTTEAPAPTATTEPVVVATGEPPVPVVVTPTVPAATPAAEPSDVVVFDGTTMARGDATTMANAFAVLFPGLEMAPPW